MKINRGGMEEEAQKSEMGEAIETETSKCCWMRRMGRVTSGVLEYIVCDLLLSAG